MYFSKCIKPILLSLCIVLCTGLYAQDLLSGNDLSRINIDKVPDAEVLKFQQQLRSNGLTLTQAEQIAISKGMPQTEFAKLRQRLNRLQGQDNNRSDMGQENQNAQTDQASQKDYKTYNKAELSEKQSKVFGALLFNTPSLSFEPNLRIAPPYNYTIGPDDELVLNIYGLQEAGFRLTVDPDGTINIPQVGIVSVAGLTLEDATKKIKERLSRTAYKNINTGLTKLSVSLGKIRSIHITIIGASKPGSYTVSSLSTLFNALFLCGGPDSIGSYREIELIRNNKVIQKVDLYAFLIRGDQRGNMILQDNDVINIPVYKSRVTIEGEVKRPGIYETKPGEMLNDILYYAGDFTDKAYTASIKVKQLTDRERRVRDIPKEQYAIYQPQRGDLLMVDSVLERYENRVTISGGVYRPGQYELTPGLTLSGLIKKADGLRQDVFLQRGLLVRTSEDLTRQAKSFMLKDVMKGGALDIPLQREDSVILASIFDFRDTLKIRIEGEVHKPGEYAYHENISLKDILFQTGGFTDAGSSYRIEVARRMSGSSVNVVSDTIAKVFEINSDKELGFEDGMFVLQPFDLITVRKKPGYVEQQRVMIDGEVVYPGAYAIQNKKDRVSDLIRRSGGMTSNAYVEGVSLYKKNNITESEKQEKLNKIRQLQSQMVITDSTQLQNEVVKPFTQIPLDIQKITSNPGGAEDIFLEDGDSLVVPKINLLIKVSGEVWSATKVNYVPGKSAFYYIDQAGGLTSNAYKSRIYVLNANGKAQSTKRYFFGLFKLYPKPMAGAEVIVPKTNPGRKMTTGEIVGLSSAFVSIAGVVIAILNLSK